MANVYAVKTGVWSDVTVWNTGALPTSADDVFANTFTVTIDINATILSLRNSASTGITAGGSYVLNGGVILTTTNGILGGSSSVPTLIYSANSPASSTINSNIFSGTTTNSNGLNITGTGTLNINGNCSVVGSTNNVIVASVFVSSNCTLNITGNLIGTNGYSGGTGISAALLVSSLSNITITGDVKGAVISPSANTASNFGLRVTGGSPNITIAGNIIGGIDTNATCNSQAISIEAGGGTLTVVGSVTAGSSRGWGITSAGTMTVNVTGDVIASSAPAILSTGGSIVNITGNVNASSAAVGASFASTSIGNITGNLTASANSPAVNTTTSTAIVTVAGNLINTNGMMAFYGARLFIASGTRSWKFTLSDNTTDKTMYSADQIIVAGTFPAVSDVRNGVSFALTQTGTCVIPPQASVATGVPVDQTTGTATIPTITLSDIWNYPLGSVTAGSVAEKIKNIATTDVTGQMLAGYKL
jgi:hypothetical protein